MENKVEPLVSVILIVFNSSKYVQEALESIKLQTYSNIELIITDDCSADDTVKICKAWLKVNKERFVNTKLITTPINTGIPKNCNRGLFAAEGEWIKLFAGDDALLYNCVESNVRFVLENPKAKIVQSNCRFYNDHLNDENFISQSKQQEVEFFRLGITALEQYKLLLYKNRLLAPSMFCNKELLESYGGFDERLRLIEDLPMWLKLTKDGVKIHVLDETTVKYRKSSDSVVKSKRALMSDTYANELINFYNLYKKGNVSSIHGIVYVLKLKFIIEVNKLGLNKEK